RADLMQVIVMQGVLIMEALGAEQVHVTGAGLENARVCAALHPGIGIGRRQLDAVPVSRIHHRQIPEIRVRARNADDWVDRFLLAPRGLEREAAPSRWVVAKRRLRGAEAVRS